MCVDIYELLLFIDFIINFARVALYLLRIWLVWIMEAF